MNQMQQMMRQAQKMQAQILKVQEQMADHREEATAGGVPLAQNPVAAGGEQRRQFAVDPLQQAVGGKEDEAAAVGQQYGPFGEVAHRFRVAALARFRDVGGDGDQGLGAVIEGRGQQQFAQPAGLGVLQADPAAALESSDGRRPDPIRRASSFSSPWTRTRSSPGSWRSAPACTTSRSSWTTSTPPWSA